MKIIKEINGYDTSRDYAALFELVKTQSIICICNYGPPDASWVCRDVCHSIYTDDGLIQISARGTCYVWANDLDDFIRQCERDQLEYIKPVR